MNTKILSILTATAACCLSACSDRELPADPVVVAPISGLVMEVGGEQYTAVPTYTGNGTFADTYLLDVKIPDQHARIVQISLADSRCTASVSAGQEVMFDSDRRLPIAVSRNGQEVGKYWVEMRFNPPPFFYFVKSGDLDADGNRYFLHRERPTKIASGTYDEYYEGEADLTASNWDNVGLVSSDLTQIYQLAAGPWPAVSSYSYLPEVKMTTDTLYFKTEGPWNDWRATNGNADIVSPGVWRVCFNTTTGQVDMTMTQWAVSGTAVGSGRRAMTFDSNSGTWQLSASLTKGTLCFETIPVAFGDPTFHLGLAAQGISQLASGGADIEVPQDGPYSITLRLSDSPYYTYSLQQQ